MDKWFNRLLGREAETSARSAKERLQLVLVHDRTDLSPALVETLKDEIIAVISRHVEIDPAGVEINLSQGQRENRLIANIPLLAASAGSRRRRK